MGGGEGDRYGLGDLFELISVGDVVYCGMAYC
jgi:hypothetical protein